MSERNDGGPAFPRGDPTHGGDHGMSLRDWFAGQALAGLLANPKLDEIAPVEEMPKSIAKCAYEASDAMLAELAKVKP